MGFKNYLESYESDLLVKDTIEKFYVKLLDYTVNTRNIKKFNKGFYVECKKFSEFKDLIIAVISKKDGRYGGFNVKGGESLIKLNILDEDSTIDDVHMYLTEDISFSVLSHEMVHYLDSKRNKTMFKNTSTAKFKKGGMKSYVNDPSEFNAHFLQALQSLDDLVLNEPELLDLPFDKFYNEAKYMILDKVFIDNMNSKYERKFKKRLYSYYKGKYK